MSVFEVLSILSVIGGISSPLIAYVIIKRSMSTDKILEIVEDISDEIMTNKELQGKLYTVGAILGNGVRQGIGINTKGGKFKLDNIIGEVVGGLAKKYLNIGGEQEQSQPQQQEANVFGQTG